MYNNSMDFYRKINAKFDKGFDDASEGKEFSPGLTYGSFKQAYVIGYREGQKVRRALKAKK